MSTQFNTASLIYMKREFGLHFLHGLRTTPSANGVKRKEPVSKESPSTVLSSLTGATTSNVSPKSNIHCTQRNVSE